TKLTGRPPPLVPYSPEAVISKGECTLSNPVCYLETVLQLLRRNSRTLWERANWVLLQVQQILSFLLMLWSDSMHVKALVIVCFVIGMYAYFESDIHDEDSCSTATKDTFVEKEQNYYNERRRIVNDRLQRSESTASRPVSPSIGNKGIDQKYDNTPL